jgi:formylglycine-generating enzyme required for sulfatase activity
MPKLRASLLYVLLIILGPYAWSNNIQVTNGGLADQNATSQFTMVKFDISWENSWRNPRNHDAAWVFVKFSANGGPWQHASINYVDGTAANDGHFAPSGARIETSSDERGVFISRDSSGGGNISWSDVKLRWNYGADGVSDLDLIEVRIFAIEMVFIPEGEFAIGSGGTNNSEFALTTILSGNAKINPSGTGNLGGQGGGYPTGETAPDNNSWPNGFNAFYCMKYEVSESQWIEFFNVLDANQQATRDITGNHPTYGGKSTDNVSNRNTVVWTSGDATTSAADRACSFLSYADGAAYSDWAGLRPMTEMEFEKACRGAGEIPTTDEFVWGTTNVSTTAYSISAGTDGQPNESISNPGVGTGNTSFNPTDGTIDGPLRCGIFAASAANPNAEETGGTFYGVMEMGGNLLEKCVNLGTPEGRAFVPNHGDGSLDANGEADVANWPPLTTGAGIGGRGGAWNLPFNSIRLSSRSDVLTTDAIRRANFGWRAVRSAE